MKTAAEWSLVFTQQIEPYDHGIPEPGIPTLEDWRLEVESAIREIQADVLEAAALECEQFAKGLKGYDDDRVLSEGVPEVIRKLKPLP